MEYNSKLILNPLLSFIIHNFSLISNINHTCPYNTIPIHLFTNLLFHIPILFYHNHYYIPTYPYPSSYLPHITTNHFFHFSISSYNSSHTYIFTYSNPMNPHHDYEFTCFPFYKNTSHLLKSMQCLFSWRGFENFVYNSDPGRSRMAKILKSSYLLKIGTISKSSTRFSRQCERELKRPLYAKVMTNKIFGATRKSQSDKDTWLWWYVMLTW